jgi:hypothetical protein
VAQLTFDQLSERIEAAIHDAGCEDRVTTSVAKAAAVQILGAHDYIPDAQRRIDADLLKKDTYYAIPDENLDLFPTLAKAALSVVSDGGMGAIGELIGLLYRYRTLNVQIDGDHAAVLHVLKAAEGAVSAADVGQRVETSGIRLGRPAGQVLAELENLQRGATVLVHNVNGRWAIGNV